MNDLLFIAEIGSNWFGNIEIAKYLHMKAKESGATHVKYQLFKADELYKPDWEYYKHAKKSELSYDTARILKEHAESIGLGWFASVHTKEDIDFLVDVKAPFIKIKGSQSRDKELIGYAMAAQYPNAKIIISYYNTDFQPPNAYNLYTTDKYPSKFEDIDFSIFGREAAHSSYRNGFSDHTQGIQASLCAAMYDNIYIFERHFTTRLREYDYHKTDIEWKRHDETKTPDHCVSLYPEQFAEMVRKIKHLKGE